MIDQTQLNEELDIALDNVREEVKRAISQHGPLFASMHEAYAVILEELEEFKAEVFKKKQDRDAFDMDSELQQVATCAIKAIITLRMKTPPSDFVIQTYGRSTKSDSPPDCDGGETTHG